MPAAKIDDRRLLEKLIDVFRVHGFEGASLSRIAEATGLQRASLYHRFPGGKEEMAAAVLEEAERQLAETVLAPLTEAGSPAARVRRMADRLAKFFGGGSRSCLLDTLALGEVEQGLRRQLKAAFVAWRDAMAAVAREAGARPAEARKRSEDALMQIEGALVYSRATGDRAVFKRVLAGLPRLLTG